MKLVVSFLFGLVAEIATGLVIGAGMAITYGRAMPSGAAELPSWVPVVATVGGFLFTFVLARWRVARQPSAPMVHALLVAAGAIALHLATSLGAARPFTMAHVVADVAKLAAGALAGVWQTRRTTAAVGQT